MSSAIDREATRSLPAQKYFAGIPPASSSTNDRGHHTLYLATIRMTPLAGTVTSSINYKTYISTAPTEEELQAGDARTAGMLNFPGAVSAHLLRSGAVLGVGCDADGLLILGADI